MAARLTCCLASATCWRSITTAISRHSNGCRVEHAATPSGLAWLRSSEHLGMEPRLKSAILVKALIRRADLAAIGIAVIARGDPDAGAILLKLNAREGGVTVLAQARRPDGTAVWLRATGQLPVTEQEA